MPNFNPANYKKLKNNIREGFSAYMEDGYCLPIIVGAVQEDIVTCYKVKDGRERNELKTYVRSKIIDLYIKERKYPFEDKIDWTKCFGLKKQIWTHFVKSYFNNEDGDEAMVKLTEKIKTNIPSEYAVWIGLYISEAMGDVFYGDNDPYINEMLYSIFDNFPSVYRGTVIGREGFSLSPVPDGNLDDEGNLIEEFDPETVDVFMDMYDDVADFDVINKQAPFSPNNLVLAIQQLEDANYDVIVVDSLSAFWASTGGAVEMAKNLGTNSFTAWDKITPIQLSTIFVFVIRIDIATNATIE